MIGIYYLWDGAAVIYVGASIRIPVRVRQHARDGLPFCGYFVDECPADQLAARELAAIKLYEPAFNTIGKPGLMA